MWFTLIGVLLSLGAKYGNGPSWFDRGEVGVLGSSCLWYVDDGKRYPPRPSVSEDTDVLLRL